MLEFKYGDLEADYLSYLNICVRATSIIPRPGSMGDPTISSNVATTNC